MLYMAPAAVCVASCVQAWNAAANAPLQYGCAAGSAGAAATAGVLTKNFTSAIPSAAGSMQGLVGANSGSTNQIVQDSGGNTLGKVVGSNVYNGDTRVGVINSNGQALTVDPATGQATNTPLGTGSPSLDQGGGPTAACITAATDAGTGIADYMTANQDAQTAQSAQNAGNSENGTTVPIGTGGQSPDNPSGNPGTAVSSTNPQTNGPCGSVTTLSTAIACAATADPNLASQLANPNFPTAFQQASGMPFEDYLKNANGLTPAQQLGAGLGGGAIPTDAAAELTGALAQDESQDQAPDLNSGGGATYAGGGGGGGSSGSDRPDLSSMMKGLMGQFGVKKPQDKTSGISALNFGKASRNLASVSAEDRTVSLFARVTFRYGVVIPGFLAGNTVLTPLPRN